MSTLEYDDLDLSDRRLRPSRLTVLLIAGIIAALGFGVGVLIQKNYGTTPASGGNTARAAAAGGFGAAGGGFPGGPGGSGAAGGTASGGNAAAATPVVVGTVTKVSGTTLTVKNFAGKSVPVKVPAGASITLVAGKTLTPLESGASVSVAGTTSPDGTVTASSVTVRS